MLGYPYGRTGGTESVKVSRDPKSGLEQMLPGVRFEEIYKVDLGPIYDEKDADGGRIAEDQIYQIPLVMSQVKFYRDRGWTIKCVYEGNLFLITAEMIVDEKSK